MSFAFATATEVVFGRGTFAALAPRVVSLGRHALVVTGSDAARTASSGSMNSPSSVDQ